MGHNTNSADPVYNSGRVRQYTIGTDILYYTIWLKGKRHKVNMYAYCRQSNMSYSSFPVPH